MKKPVQTKGAAQAAPDKAPVYISFSKDESAALRRLGLRERWLYFELKWRSNFKTGWVGTFGRQALSYLELAEVVAVPSAQGRAAQVIDDKEAARLVDRLEVAGLVSDRGRREDNNGLKLRLPLSPIVAPKEKAEVAARPAKKLPLAAPETAPQTPDWDLGFADSDGSLSVMMPYRHNNTIFSNEADASNGAGDTPSPRCTECSSPPLNSFENRPSGQGPLTVSEIKQRFQSSPRGFAFITSRESQQLYKDWIARNVTREAFEAATLRLENDFGKTPTPLEIDKLLSKPSRNGTGRGRVAL